MVSRTVLYLFLLTARGIAWFLEQPMTPLLELHPRFQQLRRLVPVYKMFIWLGAYEGSGSPKPSFIYSNYPFVNELWRSLAGLIVFY